MTRRHLIFICNALDDATRARRRITTDSPAGSRKVFLAAKAARHAGVRPLVFSYGRGRQDGSGEMFKAFVRRVGGAPVLYAPFAHRRITGAFLSFFVPVLLLFRLARLRGLKTVVFYNRMPMYLPVLMAASVLGFRMTLDLEDGEDAVPSASLRGIVSGAVRTLFDRLCRDGALLACRKLESMTSIRPAMCYYGAVETVGGAPDWDAESLTVLMCGTIWRSTGAMVLVEAIERLRRNTPDWASNVQFAVTGQGDCIAEFEKLAAAGGNPRVSVYGRLSYADYNRLLENAHVGLALKLNSGTLADSTFPSKVVEFANAGLLVLSTDISDVRPVFGPNVLYLEDDDPELLVERLRWVAENRECAMAMAMAAQRCIYDRFTLPQAGKALAGFLFPD